MQGAINKLRNNSLNKSTRDVGGNLSRKKSMAKKKLESGKHDHSHNKDASKAENMRYKF